MSTLDCAAAEQAAESTLARVMGRSASARGLSAALGGGAAPEPELSGAGFTYRHNWGRRRGQWTLRLNMAGVTPRSLVFVSIGEGAAGGAEAGKFVGAARYTVHNVAPRAGGVDILVNIEWGSDILLYADYLVVNPVGSELRTVSVTVQRHATVALSDAEADRILADMGAALQTAHTGADVATPVRFVRNGAVRTLPATVPATIQTQAEWNTLMGAGSGVKVVRAIRWCGGPGGSIIGCAPVGNPNVNLAVVRFTANQEGILWAHEYGHNAGNGHRSNDARALMFPSIGADHNVVDATESGRYLAGPQAATGAVMRLACSCEDEAMTPPPDIREFVTQHWYEGVPYAQAVQYGPADAQRLVDWLAQPDAQTEPFLPEIVTTLCYIGSDAAVQPLVDFVQGPRHSQAAFNAKNAALIHLGDLVRATGNRSALAFLARMAGDMAAAEAVAGPRAAQQGLEAAQAGVVPDSAQALAAELAVSATFGLALSGAPEAQALVAQLQDSAQAFSAVNLAAAEAVAVAQQVQAAAAQALDYRRQPVGQGTPR